MKAFPLLCGFFLSTPLIAGVLEPRFEQSIYDSGITTCTSFFHPDLEQKSPVKFCRQTQFFFEDHRIQNRTFCYAWALDTRNYYGPDDSHANTVYLKLNQEVEVEFAMRRTYCSGYGTPCYIVTEEFSCERNGLLEFEFRFNRDVYQASRDNLGQQYSAQLPYALH